MGVHGNSGFTKRCVEDDVSGFTTNARQCFELSASAGHLTAMPFDQLLAKGDDMLRLIVEEPKRTDMGLHPLKPQCHHGVRRVGGGKERPGGFIYANVGGLRGQHHGNQQLEWALPVQLCGGVWVSVAKTHKKIVACGLVHGQLRAVSVLRRKCQAV